MLRVVLYSFIFSIALNSQTLLAKETIAAILEKADKLVEVVPDYSEEIAQRFLTTRTLIIDNAKQPLNNFSKQEPNDKIRTPKTSIQALQVIAKAKYTTGDTEKALEYIEQAIRLARTYKLLQLQSSTQLLKAKLIWQLTQDKDQVQSLISQIEDFLTHQKTSSNKVLLRYHLLMFKAEIETSLENEKLALNYFAEASQYLPEINSEETDIQHQITLGEYHLINQNHHKALYLLTSAYWSAIEMDKAILLAKTNHIIAKLFLQRSVLDKALEHLSQAADFYYNYKNSIVLSPILKQMADIYYSQGKYNLALVHYFNALDSEAINQNKESIVELRIDLAKTYLNIYNYPLATQYLTQANELLSLMDNERLNTLSLLVKTELLFFKGRFDTELDDIKNALATAKKINDTDLQIYALKLLIRFYEHKQRYSEAYKNGRTYIELMNKKQEKLLTLSESDFKKQLSSIEQALHFEKQTKLLASSKEKKAFLEYAVVALSTLLFLTYTQLLWRGRLNRKMKTQLNRLYKEYYTHPRSGLKNFRLLNVNLPSSLKKSRAHFEHWKTGELISEPLHDKLRLVMIELPCLRTIYLQEGYHSGLQLEEDFGQFIKTKLKKPARLYHFSDTMFLYIEPNTDPSKTTKELYEQIHLWIKEFKTEKTLNRTIRMGIIEYPFLPRAYTAINDKELIDILLMASNLARLLNHQYTGSQWVSLKAINSAPAASFVNEDIRIACLAAIKKGLIKIDSSEKVEDSTVELCIMD